MSDRSANGDVGAAAASLEDPEILARKKRLRIRCWRRGTREMDLLLGGYADARLAEMDLDALEAFEALIEIEDDTLYRWLSGAEAAPAPHAPLIEAILRDRGAHP